MSSSLYAVIVGLLVLWLISLYEPSHSEVIWDYPPPRFPWTIDINCTKVHYVLPNETPWLLAHYYAPAGYEWSWINGMFQYSFVSDGKIYAGQPICVAWTKPMSTIVYEDQIPITIWR